MRLTNEQQAIVESKGNIRVNAVAGSGKTTTLIEYAKSQHGSSRILYIAFNRSVKIEAERKFKDAGLSNVTIETAHSLAYNYIVRAGKYKVKKEGNYRTTEIAEILGLAGVAGQKHFEYVLASHVNKFLLYFCNSAKDKVQDLDYAETITDSKAKIFVENFASQILGETRVLLSKMDKAEVEITHDFYLKKFQQLKPELPYDIILFDEGQDASEAMLDVFISQRRAIKVIVGDTHQQIYSWRYAINSLEKVDFPIFYLSNSFRFNTEIASLASRVLEWKKYIGIKGRIQINGCGTDTKGRSRAVLARTNMGLLIKAIELLVERKEIKKVYFEGRFDRYTYVDEGASLFDILNLYLGRLGEIRDKLIANMNSIEELEEYIEKTEDVQLGALIEVVKKYGEKLPDYINTIKKNHIESDDKSKAELIFSTVHKSKGMEYDEVTLVEDFINEEKLRKLIEKYSLSKLNVNQINEEINLLYVGITRAKSHLNIPSNLMPMSSITII